MVHSFKAVPVLVTGAGRGIGKRLAIGFAGKGARVGLLARSKAELDLCHLEIEHGGGAALRIRADVCDYEQVSAALERMRVQFGSPVQVLVCAAAMLGPIGPFVETSPKSWHEIVQTNLIGVMNACRAVLPQMLERRSGKIIVVAGVGGVLPSRPNFAVHSATKTAVVRFVESLAEEVAEHNVQVNCLSPGETYTHMTDQVLAAGERAGWREIETAQQVRMTGGVPAEKQIELALFLASPQSNHVTGRMIHVADDWKKLKDRSITPELYRLRRNQKT
ncbi:MAG: short-chain dehydrogenase/reductase [Bryobacterales bacterium]|nr:short-chain dehydrogenase/reductase [Bryobacterales bacterium]